VGEGAEGGTWKKLLTFTSSIVCNAYGGKPHNFEFVPRPGEVGRGNVSFHSNSRYIDRFDFRVRAN